MANVIEPTDLILVGGSGPNCNFQKYDGTYETGSDQHCTADWENPDGLEHNQVHYACKKPSKCGKTWTCSVAFARVKLKLYTFSGKISDCRDIPSNPSACYMNLGKGPFAKDMCDQVNGYPARLTKAGDAAELWQIFEGETNLWVGLTTTTDM